MQSQTLTDSQTFVATFTPTDAEGNPGSYIGTPNWSSDNTAVATATPDTSNPLSATIKGIAPGTANITCSVQNPASIPVPVSFQAVVTGGPVTGGTFSFTTPA